MGEKKKKEKKFNDCLLLILTRVLLRLNEKKYQYWLKKIDYTNYLER